VFGTLRSVKAHFEDILGAAQANAEWAWAALYDDHAPTALQYLRSRRLSDPEAVLGDVFVRVVRGIHGFDGDEDAFRGWLFRIVQRCAIDAARSDSTDPATDHVPEQTSPDAADEVLRTLSEARVYEVLDVLSPDQRAVVFLRVIADLSIAEVASILGRPPAAVKMLQQRAFRTLKKRGLP
jgi:RNA polymerase sigma-70 factor (ECF subfamily)